MNINESIFMALKVSESAKVPLLLIGNPGVGKTTSVEYYAEITKKKMVLLRGSQSSPEEILGYEVNDDAVYTSGKHAGEKKMSTSRLRPTWYLEVIEADEMGIPTLLFLDEITTANEFIQSALLQLVFGKSLDDENKLPKSCFIVAAGNYASNLSSSFNVIPPLLNRFCIFNVVASLDDIPMFLSRYSRREDAKSALEMFDLKFSITGSYDEGFEKVAKSKIETKLVALIKSFMSSKKFCPEMTDMSGIYTDTTNNDTRLPGFLSLRTMCYFREMFIAMYLNYGSKGACSEVFDNIIFGLVGVSLSSSSKGKNGSGPGYVSLLSEFKSFVSSVSEELDKMMVKSINRTEGQLRSLIVRMNTMGNSVSSKRLDSPKLIQISKILEAAEADKSMESVESPIGVDVINELADIILSSAQSAFNVKKRSDEDLSIEDIMKEGSDKFLKELDTFNGEMKLFNSSVRCYNALNSFVNKKCFKYPSDVINKISDDLMTSMINNSVRVSDLKDRFSETSKIDFTEIVETEEIK